MNGIAWKPVSIVAGLLLLLTYLLSQSRNPDLALCARMQETLQALQLRDAELTRDALLVRAQLLPSYDSLARTRADLFRVLETLRGESATGSAEVAQAVNQQIEALGAALQEKVTRLEYFKSDAALLRNSVMYFDHAGQALRTRADGDRELMADLGALSHAMLHFMQAPRTSSAQEIQALLNGLSSPALSQAEPRALIAHGRLISQVLPEVDDHLHQILAVPTATYARALQGALLQYSSRVEARAQVFRFLLYLAALILLGYLIYQFVRLRLSAAQLRCTNEELSQKIAERERLQEANRQQELQLIQANKMTALGILVSGVAHEINNPNQLVLTNSRVLRKVWDDSVKILDGFQRASGDFTLAGLAYAEMRETVAALIRDVHTGALRIGRIVDDLKNFARPRARGVPAAFQLNDAVQRATRLLAHLINQRTATLRTHLAPNLPPMRGDAQQVEQIVINILVNALEALPDHERAVSVSTFFDSEEHTIILEVRDEGIGIPREHLERLCDPFFTTKEETGGTGLGLAITSSLVRAHSGWLVFDSEPGKGTRVLVKFQCTDEPIPLYSEASA